MDYRDLIILLVFLTISVFFVFVAFVLYFLCRKYKHRRADLVEERESLITNSTQHFMYETQESSFIDINLVELQKQEQQKSRVETQQSAFLYLQFFIRSNTNLDCKSIEQLPLIGTHLQRTWFLIVDNSKKKIMVLVDKFRSDAKKKLLQDIADSMEINGQDLKEIVDEILTTLKHPNLLPFYKAEVDMDKSRILLLQQYSAEGSLRDLVQNTKPLYDYSSKMKRQVANPLVSQVLKYYTKQIVSALIHLRNNGMAPLYRLHAGNVILSKNKTVCQIAGYEDMLFDDSDCGMLADKRWTAIRRTYYIESESDEFKLKKATSEFELKQVVEVLRLGQLIIEVYTGIIDTRKIIPDAAVLKAIETYNDPKSAMEVIDFINFLFYNRQNLNDNNPKLMGNFVIPTLEEIDQHEFLRSIKQKNDSADSVNLTEPDNLLFLSYLNGKTKLRPKAINRRTSNISAFNINKKKMSEANLKRKVSVKPAETKNSKTTTIVSDPVAPPAPPLPPPPPMSTSVPKQTASTSNRGALLDSIKTGKQLKKTVTNDRSQPKI